MYKKIMVPVDLAHVDHLGKALGVAGQLAKANGAAIAYVGVTTSQPSATAHSPEEFDAKLTAFAQAQGAANGVPVSAVTMISHDPAVDLNDTLFDAIEQTGADLVVMQSHIPNAADYIWPSHGGKLAGHAEISVFVVR